MVEYSSEVNLESFRKLQETVQLLLNGQESLIKICNKQKAELKKLKEKIKAKDEEFKEFRDRVSPFFEKFVWEKVEIDKVRSKIMF